MTPMIGPKPVACENAMPLLKARLNRSVQMTSIGPSSSALSAHCLVSWSIRTTTAAMARDPRSERARPLISPTTHPVQRRPIPPTFSSTSTAAHGIALSRSFGIGRPEMME